MNILQKYALVKMRFDEDVPSFPPLFRGMKRIPKLLIFCWVGVVALQLVSVESSGGHSLVSLLTFIALTIMIVPVLTYISVYKVSSSLIRGVVSKRYISKWMSFVSKVLLSVLLISFACSKFSIPFLGSYILPPVGFVFLMVVSWIKFRKEIKVLAVARDFIMTSHHTKITPPNTLMSNGKDESYEVNPANGLPMANTAIDVLGNPRGIDSTVFLFDDFHTSNTDSHSPGQAAGSVNPATGLPMIDSTFDSQGNSWGSATNDFQDHR